MRRKQLAKRVAIAVLSAATVMTAAPVGTFAATNVVSVDASDANAYGSQTVDDAKLKKELTDALATYTVPNTVSSADVSNLNITMTDYNLTNYEVTAHTAPSYTTTAGGGKIVMPVLTVTADAFKGSSQNTADRCGKVTFTVDAGALTRSEQVDAVVAVLNGAGGQTIVDPNTYGNADNSTSLKDQVKAILDNTQNGSKITGLDKITYSNETAGSKDVSLKVSQTSITPATKTAAGSETVSVEVSAVLDHLSADKNGTKDPAWDATKDQTQDQEYKKTASYTATIAKLGVTTDDTDYQARVEAALANTKLKNSDFAQKIASKENMDQTFANKSGDTADTTIKNAIEAAVGTRENTNVTINYRNFKAATHAKDGSVTVLLDQARTSVNGSTETVHAYATVTIPVVHEGDTAAIEKEVNDKVASVWKAVSTDSKDVSPKSLDADEQKKEVQAALQSKMEEALQDKLSGTNTIASEIDKVEVTATINSAATTKTAGSATYNVLVTYKDNAPAQEDITAPTGFSVGVKGKKVRYTATNNFNIYHIDGVEATGLSLDDEYVISAQDTLGNSKVTVTPKFTPASANEYKIRWTLDDDTKFAIVNGYTNANLTGANTSAKTAYTSNEGVTVKVKNAGGAEIGDTVELTAQLIDSDDLVAATAKTTLKIVKGFVDVQNTHSYEYKPINYLAQNKVVKKGDNYTNVAVIAGVGDNKFNPTGEVTRGQFVTFLYRLAQQQSQTTTTVAAEDVNGDVTATLTVDGKANTQVTSSQAAGVKHSQNHDASLVIPVWKDADAQTKFTDVDSKAYYAKAVDWAVANGIANGTSDTTFNPNGKVTRAEAVTFLYRYYAAGQSYNAANFEDVKTGSWFANAVGWASSNGVTQGKDATHFAPSDTTTRAEAAAFIYRATNSAKINK